MIECEPRERLTGSCATLLERFAEPSEVDPSKKVTVPLARSPLMEGATLAVKVIVWPYEPGLGLAATETDVLAGFMLCVNALEVLAR